MFSKEFLKYLSDTEKNIVQKEKPHSENSVAKSLLYIVLKCNTNTKRA